MTDISPSHRLWKPISLVVALCLPGTSAQAATISTQPEPVMGCFAQLSGTIEKGDAEKLRPIIEKNRYSTQFQDGDDDLSAGKARVCFDSPGGSLIEGVAIAKLLHDNRIGSAVGRGKSCLSACAVAFMGGLSSYENDMADQPNRVVHPLGKLGFHAPDLGVPQGEYDETTVKQAYVVAVKSVAAVLDMSLEVNFPTSLATVMLGTPAQDMYLIDTIDEAARWRVAIAPVVEPARLTKAGLATSCAHIDNASDDNAWYSMPSSSEISFERGYNDHWIGTMQDGFQQEGATGCTATFHPLKPGDKGRSTPSGFGSITANSVHIWAYQTYGPDVKIASLALADDTQAEIRTSTTRQRSQLLTGRCIVLNATAVLDNDPCTLSRTQKLDEIALNEHQTDVFIWPSGAKTVVESGVSDSGKYINRLNGLETKEEVFFSKDDVPHRNIIDRIAQKMGNNDPLIACWANPSSGNRFCYLDAKTLNTTDYFQSYYQ
jgi:hypothetical protein